MNGQLAFDDAPGLVQANHPDTSRAAALGVLPRTGTQRRRVYDYLVRQGDLGASDYELQHWLEMDGNTERPRRVELVNAGLVVDSGRTVAIHGRPMIVWVAVR